jgi:cytochrome c-type biogenesis protein CcmH/NrfG
MKAESIVIGVAGTVFGLIVGWIIGTQQAPARPFAQVAASPAAAQAPASMPPAASAVVDEAQVTALRNIADKDPSNVQSRVQLGNMYFDAERYQDAIQWYEAALKLNPNDVSVSTDLGVCFYYTNQPDRAIRQMEESLRIDPRHTKTLLNLGIVKAFGKQDLVGAAAAWEEVVKIAPGSQEA